MHIPVLKWSEVTQLCVTFCNPTDCSLSSSSIHGIFQARVLEWAAISFYRGSSRPRDWTQVSHIVGRHFTVWATREALIDLFIKKNFFLFFSHLFFISWRLITLQYCSGFCHTLTWISHGFTCVPHPESPSHLPPYPIPLGHPSAPALSTCLLHPPWTGDLLEALI